MTFKRVGYAVLTGGGLLVFLSIMIDYFGIGKRGIQSAQLLGILLGILTILIGIGLILSSDQAKFDFPSSLRAMLRWVQNLPPLTWLILGFLFIFMLWIIFPMFFNDIHRMKYFLRYIPDKFPLGLDFNYSTGVIQMWLSGRNMYDLDIHLYPPLYAVVFAPILLLNYPESYFFISTATLVFFLLPFFLFRSVAKRNFSYLTFFLLTGLVSYGIQFELERGQFNVIAVALCLLSIYLFHYHYSFRHLAYFLFSVSAQIKIYPAIFIFLFIKDWRDWKGNLIRLAGLGAFNFALLFVLGYKIFLDFIQNLQSYLGNAFLFPGNHSLKAFAHNLTHFGFGLFSPAAQTWLLDHDAWIEAAFFLWFFACFGIILLNAYKRNRDGVNVNLLLACTIAAMILPSISNDYKLPMLAAPLALVFSSLRPVEGTKWKALSILSILLISVSYSATLIPYIYRPAYLQHSLPFLLAILTAVTILDSTPIRETQPASEQSLQ